MKRTLAVVVILACIGMLAFPLYVLHCRRTCADFRWAGNHCMSNLSQLGKAILMYSMNHDGLCPPQLIGLPPDYWLAATKVFCPYGRRDGRVGRYVYFRPEGKLPDLSKDTPLAADYPDNHTDGGNVLYADGSVVWMNEGFSDFVASNTPPDVQLLDNNLKWYEWKRDNL